MEAWESNHDENTSEAVKEFMQSIADWIFMTEITLENMHQDAKSSDQIAEIELVLAAKGSESVLKEKKWEQSQTEAKEILLGIQIKDYKKMAEKFIEFKDSGVTK